MMLMRRQMCCVRYAALFLAGEEGGDLTQLCKLRFGLVCQDTPTGMPGSQTRKRTPLMSSRHMHA